MRNYFVLRIANKLDGTAVVPASSYESKQDAQKEFYRLCGQAVDSTHLTDTVMLVSKEGVTLDFKCFEHSAPEPEPVEEGEGE